MTDLMRSIARAGWHSVRFVLRLAVTFMALGA